MIGVLSRMYVSGPKRKGHLERAYKADTLIPAHSLLLFIILCLWEFVQGLVLITWPCHRDYLSGEEIIAPTF